MNIILTEETLKQVMDSMINEALGVPDNIYETAVIIFKDLHADVKVLTINDFRHDYIEVEGGTNAQESYKTSFKIGRKYTIGTQYFFHVIMDLNIYPTPKAKKTTMINMAFLSNAYYKDEIKRIKVPQNGGMELRMELAVTPDWTIGDIINYFSTNQKEILESITHELKHAFDSRKGNGSKPQNVAHYTAVSNFRTGVPPIDQFFHYLYFITATENMVRPSEVAADMKYSNVKQKEFRDFLSNNRVYKQLQEIKNWSYESLKLQLLRHMTKIDNILSSVNINPNNMTPEEKVDKFLHIIYINLVNSKGNFMMQIMATNPFEGIFGFETDKSKMIDNFVNSLSKYENNFNGFYEHEEKMFKFVSDKMIRKIAKLYDMANNEEDMKTESTSIVDWDLHQEIKNTKKVTYQTEIKSPSKKKGQK